MEYSYRDLRAMANTPGLCETATDSALVNEAVEELLSEAYYGRKQVQKMRDAMDKIRLAYLKNPDLNLNFNSDVNKNLQQAICDAFGFKRCTVYWTNSTNIRNGPFTMPTSRVLADDGKTYIVNGANPNGYYDKDHRMAVVISSDLCLFGDPINLTTDEMVGIFLHEIGHNFDYTMWGLVRGWMIILDIIMKVIERLQKGEVVGAAETAITNTLILVVRDSYPELLAYVVNWQDLITNIIPPHWHSCSDDWSCCSAGYEIDLDYLPAA